jgi:hypothetical protein
MNNKASFFEDLFQYVISERTGWTTENSAFDFWQGQKIFLFSRAPTLAVGRLNMSSIQWIPVFGGGGSLWEAPRAT